MRSDYTQFLGPQQAAIFLFMGVHGGHSHTVRNYNNKHISLEDFTGLLQSLQAAGAVPVTLLQIVEWIKGRGTLPDRAVHLTFDDGHRNAYELAFPLVQDLGFFSTLFVPTSFIGCSGMSWADRLDYAIEHTATPQIELPMECIRRNVGGTGLEGHGPWTLQLGDTARKIAALRAMRQLVKRNCVSNIEGFVKEVFKRCQVDLIRSGRDPLDRKLGWALLDRLSRNPMFEIGSKGHDHYPLGFRTASEMALDVRRASEAMIGHSIRPPRFFAYPEGDPELGHYTKREERHLQRMEYRAVLSAVEGVVTRTSNLFALPRIYAGFSV